MANLFPETIKLIEQIYGPKKDYPIDSDKEQLKDLATKAAIENSTKTPEEKEKTERKTLLDRRSYDLVEFDRNKVFTGEIKPGINKRIKYLPYIRNKVGTIIFDTDIANTYENRRFQIPFHTKKLSKNQLIKTVKTQYEEFIYKQEDVDPIKKKIDELTNANGKLTEAINTKDTKIKTLQTTIANIKPCEPPAVTEIPAPIPAPAPAPVTVPPPPPPPPPVVTTPAPAPTPTVTAPAPAAPTPAPVKNLQFKDPNSFANRGDAVYKSLENDIRSNAFTLSSGLYGKTRQLSEWDSIVSRLRNKINFTYAQNFSVKSYFTRVLNDVDAAVKTSATTGIVSVNFIL